MVSIRSDNRSTLYLLVVVVRLQRLGASGQVLERMAAVIKSEGQVLCNLENTHISVLCIMVWPTVSFRNIQGFLRFLKRFLYSFLSVL